MLGLLRNFVSPKVGVRLIVRVKLSITEALDLQALVRSFNLNGLIQVMPRSHVLIELEGPKAKLEALVERLQRIRLSSPAVMEVSWRPFTAEFRVFRVKM